MSRTTEQKQSNEERPNTKAALWAEILPYKWWFTGIFFFLLISNGVGILLPQAIGQIIDEFLTDNFDQTTALLQLGVIIVISFGAALTQVTLSVVTSERIGRDMRERLARKIGKQRYAYIVHITPSKLLSNFTSDVNTFKNVLTQSLISVASSIVFIIGSAIILITIRWQLALITLSIIPVISVLFWFIYSRIRTIFKEDRKVVDKTNRVIQETIIGAMLVRVLNTFNREMDQFDVVNSRTRTLRLRIIRLFGSLFPITRFLGNMGLIIVIWFGGNSVIQGTFSLGEFTAFYTYASTMIGPIITIGFISSSIAQGMVSYGRIQEVLNAATPKTDGNDPIDLQGNITFDHVSLRYQKTTVLDDISFTLQPGVNAIVGPTAAGKTQLMQLVAGLIEPTEGTITFEGTPLADINQQQLFTQMGIVFQDNVIFHSSARENITFTDPVSEKQLERAMHTAAVDTFVDDLPDGQDTIISERGTSLSGGQKQRIMLARALVREPQLLLLDDFTARVDRNTEQRIFERMRENYPNTSQLIVSQKISSIINADHILFLMEGELLAQGTHTELLKCSLEYRQLYESQQSIEQ